MGFLGGLVPESQGLGSIFAPPQQQKAMTGGPIREPDFRKQAEQFLQVTKQQSTPELMAQTMEKMRKAWLVRQQIMRKGK